MIWRIRIDGVELTDDDLTVEECEAYERVTGDGGWLAPNPVQSIRHARAFLTIALMRAGLDDKAIAERLQGMTRKDLRGVFTFEPDVDARRLIEAAQKDGPEPVPLERLLSRSSGGSSSGVSAGSGGRRKKRAAS